MSENFDQYRTRIVQLVAGLFMFVLMAYSVHGLMFGSHGLAALIAALVVGVGAVLALDKYYWILFLLIPAVGVTLPELPFSSSELGALVLITVYFARSAFHRDQYYCTSTGLITPALPYLCWVFFVFLLNPVGLNFFGSTMIGGRHYFDIALGFVAMIILSRIELSERGLKVVFFALILASFLNVGLDYYSYRTGFDLDPEQVGTRYYLLPLGTVVMLLLAKHDLSKILTSPLLIFVCCLLTALTFFSGKRTSTGSILLMPFVLMFLRRRDYLLTLSIAVVGAFVLAIIIAGHGLFYELPKPIQRSLSFLPGQWDRRYEQMGFHDDFREELQGRAREIILANPWVGRSGFAMDVNEIRWVALYTGAGDSMYAGHVLAGNWHNKFWGMWADFGVVAPFAWYGFVIFVVVWGVRQRNLFEDDSYSSAFYRYWLFTMILDLILAYGHSAITPFSRWQTFGLLLALHNMRKSQMSALSGFTSNDSSTTSVPSLST